MKPERARKSFFMCDKDGLLGVARKDVRTYGEDKRPLAPRSLSLSLPKGTTCFASADSVNPSCSRIYGTTVPRLIHSIHACTRMGHTHAQRLNSQQLAFAREDLPDGLSLLQVAQQVKPTMLVGVSACRGLFNEVGGCRPRLSLCGRCLAGGSIDDPGLILLSTTPLTTDPTHAGAGAGGGEAHGAALHFPALQPHVGGGVHGRRGLPVDRGCASFSLSLVYV